MPRISVRNVTKRYGDLTVLDNVSLDILDGEYVSVIGPSGCGKTTLLRCIAGIIEPNEGEITVDDQPLVGKPPERRNIGYMFQEIALFPHMNVRGNAGYGPRVRGFAGRKIQTIANDTLEMVKLTERSKSYPNELSGGAKQKVALARAIASEPSMLLLDEPLGSLDTNVRLNLRQELRRLVKDLKLTAVHVTHDQDEAMSISDRVIIMRAGRIVEVGKPQDLYLNPREIFTANFLGEANFASGTVVTTGEECMTLDIQGRRLDISPRSMPKEVIVAIRPQFIQTAKETGAPGVWRGKVIERTFLGDSVRLELDLNSGLKMVAQTLSTIQDIEADVGDEVTVSFQRDKVLTFEHPAEGLDKELSTG